MDNHLSKLKPVHRRLIEKKKPPPVAKKPTEAAKQRKLAEKKAQNLQKGRPSEGVALPPPIGYNDADRFYISSPVPSDHNSFGSQDSLNEHILNDTSQSVKPVSKSSTNHKKNSRWLDKQINNLQRRHNKPEQHMARNAQTDTQELEVDHAKQKRILREKISDLETENKIKDRELDTNRWIEKEMDRKLRTTEDMFVLKQYLKDKDRLIESLEKSNRELVEDNSRYEEEIAEKERFIFELQAEVDNLDRVIVAKNALREGEKLREVNDELDRSKDDLAALEHDVERQKKEISNLHYQLERKEREVALKNEKIDQLNKELNDINKDIGEVESEKMAVENHLKTADRENKGLREQEAKHAELKQKYQALREECDYLRDTVRALEGKIRHLEGVQKDKEALQDAVVDLKAAVQDKNQISRDKKKLEEELQMLRETLRDKVADEACALRELDQVKIYSGELEKENEFYRDLEKDFNTLKVNFEDLERKKHKNDRIIAQLRPKVQRLQNRCREKDDLIRRLASELRSTSDYLPKSLLLEADRNQAKALDDYINPADLILSDEPSLPISEIHNKPSNSQPRPTRSQNLVRELRPDLLSPSWNEPLYIHPPGDSLHVPRQQRTSLSPQSKRRPFVMNPAASSLAQPTGVRRSYSPPQRQEHSPRKYGRDRRSGKPLEGPSDNSLAQYPNQPEHADPETSKLHAPMQESSYPDVAKFNKGDTFPLPQRKTGDAKLEPPINPGVSRVLSDGSVMLEWDPPQLDHLDRNSGVVVAGYKVFIDDVEDQQVSSSRLTKALVAPDLVTKKSKISLQTFGYDGELSEKVTIGMQDHRNSSNTSGPIPQFSADDNPVRLRNRTPNQSFDAIEPHINANENSGVSRFPERPDRNSQMKPDIYPESKSTAGPSAARYPETKSTDNPDTNFMGYPDTRRNLDPENASTKPNDVDRIPNVLNGYLENRRNSFPSESPQQNSPRRSQPTSREISPRRSKLTDPTDVLHARRDYDPSEHSPSAFPSYELAFKQGDAIEIFGPVRPDGLYNAQINGRRGVVPAQYLDFD